MFVSSKRISFDVVSYYSLIIFALTLPLSRAMISFFIFWLLLLVLYKRDYKSSFSTLKENKIFIFLALMIIYFLLTSFWSDDKRYMLKHIRLYGYFILVPCFVILVKKEWLNKILNAFLVGMFIHIVISYLVFFELISLDGINHNAPSPFMITIHYSVYLAFAALVVLYKAVKADSNLKKMTLFVFFVLLIINLFISTGRTGQLAFFVMIFVSIFIIFRLNIKVVLGSVVLVTSIFLVSYNSIDIFKNRVDYAISDTTNIIKNRTYHSSFGLRAAFWILTYDGLKEKTIFGYGLGDHQVAAKELVDKNRYQYFNQFVVDFITSGHYHNQYLMILIECGLLGLFLFLLFIYKVLSLKIENKELKYVSIIGIGVYLVSFVGDPMLIMQFPLALFLFIVAFSIASSKNNK